MMLLSLLLAATLGVTGDNALSGTDWLPPDPRTINVVTASFNQAVKEQDPDALEFVDILASAWHSAHGTDTKGFPQFVGCVGAGIGGLDALHVLHFAKGIEAMQTSGSFKTYVDSLPPEAAVYGQRIGELHSLAYNCNKLIAESLSAKR